MKPALKKLEKPSLGTSRRRLLKDDAAIKDSSLEPIPSIKKKSSLKSAPPKLPSKKNLSKPSADKTLAKAPTAKKTALPPKDETPKKKPAKTKTVSKTPQRQNGLRPEETIAPPPKPRPKSLKPLGKAVFRGKKELYDFKVFSLDESFEAIPAVYVISKRKTDKNRRAHHLLLCIGQTDSVIEAIKKHRKNRCLKKNEANVISLLREFDPQKRLQIAADLKSAHAYTCNLEEVRTES